MNQRFSFFKMSWVYVSPKTFGDKLVFLLQLPGAFIKFHFGINNIDLMYCVLHMGLSMVLLDWRIYANYYKR